MSPEVPTLEGMTSARDTMRWLHTYREVPLAKTEWARIPVPKATPADLFAQLRTEESNTVITLSSLYQWSRYPCVISGERYPTPMPLPLLKLWHATPFDTQDAVLVAYAMLSSAFNKGWNPEAPRMPRVRVSSVFESSAEGQSLFHAAYGHLRTLPYAMTHLRMCAAQLAAGAVEEGVSLAEFSAKIDAALEVVPTLTVDGEPVTEALSTLLDPWVSPLFGMPARR